MPPKDVLKPVFLTLATGVAVVTVLLACPDFLSGKEVDTYLPLPVAETGRLDVSLPFDVPPSAPSGPHQANAVSGGGGGASRASVNAATAPPANIPEATRNVSARVPPSLATAGAPQSGEGGSGKGSGNPLVQGAPAGLSVPGELIAKLYDHKLVAVESYELEYTYGLGELSELKHDVVVSVTIDGDGKVTGSKAVSGPEKLLGLGEAVAMRWRFEPLARHGLTPPLVVNLIFHPKVKAR